MTDLALSWFSAQRSDTVAMSAPTGKIDLPGLCRHVSDILSDRNLTENVAPALALVEDGGQDHGAPPVAKRYLSTALFKEQGQR